MAQQPLSSHLDFSGSKHGRVPFHCRQSKPSSTGFIAWFHWWSVRKIQQHLQCGVNVGLQPFYSISGIRHGTSLPTGILRMMQHGPGQPTLLLSSWHKHHLTPGLSIPPITSQSSQLVPNRLPQYMHQIPQGVRQVSQDAWVIPPDGETQSEVR